jgi:hypothetical protein
MGTVDFDRGTIWTAGLGPVRCPERIVDRKPVLVSYMFGDRPTGADPQPGRVARRTLPGQTMVWGRARDDVTAVTIATPRDVRTLSPSPRAHAFLAVYDGDFPTGEIVVTAHLRDGSSRVVDRFAMGGL